MKRELFIPYKETILKCISSSVTPVQLLVSYDLMERFEERFRGVVKYQELNEALEQLHYSYAVKVTRLHVI